MTQHLYGNANYGLDVLSLDIQRGRDHGLPSYTDYRKLCGLSDVKRFKDLLGEMTPEVIKTKGKYFRLVLFLTITFLGRTIIGTNLRKSERHRFNHWRYFGET